MNWSSFLYVDFENGNESTVQLLLSIKADIGVCLKDGSVLYILFTKIKLTCFIDKYIYAWITMDIQADFVDHVENKTLDNFTDFCSQILWSLQDKVSKYM